MGDQVVKSLLKFPLLSQAHLPRVQFNCFCLYKQRCPGQRWVSRDEAVLAAILSVPVYMAAVLRATALQPLARCLLSTDYSQALAEGNVLMIGFMDEKLVCIDGSPSIHSFCLKP